MNIAGMPTTLSTAGTGLEFASVSAEVTANGVQLHVDYLRPDQGLRIRRSYACYPMSPVVEMWTSIQSSDRRHSPSISDLVVWRAGVAPGTIRWVNGLQGDNADVKHDEAFTPQHRDLAAGETLRLGSDRRSSERQVPIAVLDAQVNLGAQFLVGAMWSGPWRMAFTAQPSRLEASVDFPDLVTTIGPDRPFESPHVFVGSVPGPAADVAVGLRPFIDNGIRAGRALAPLATYNTWYSYGIAMDADAIAREIERSADLGLELFVIDAGWYSTPGAKNSSDFEAGLGVWQADPDRFPDGLRPLRDAAHARGMKFGLWVEPERLSLAMLREIDGARASWLATTNGSYGSPTTAQICFGTRAARQWMIGRLTALIEEVGPDYLKWDNNFWITCNGAGHDHGAADGAFAHVRGLYDVLDQIRTRFPALLIENVSGGGNRLDFGWLRYSDTAWMSDRTSPSSHVRHNFEGLATFFPPAYLLAFALESSQEPLSRGDDVPLYLRSRVPGILGLAYQRDSLSETTRDAVRDAVRLYKDVRLIALGADAFLLSPPADPADPSRWDIVEELDSATGNAVLFAFQGEAASATTKVFPRGLQPATLYEVRSADVGILGTSTGDGLMRDGIDVGNGSGSRAHVLMLLTRPVSTGSSAR
jgi:alpha-galactosidase